MKILDFLKRKKSVVENQEEPVKEVKQGFYRERKFFPSTPLSTPQNEPESWMNLEGKYKDNAKVGRWTIKDNSGHEQGYIHFDEHGRKHGLEKTPAGGYTLYHHGQKIKSNLEITKEWRRNVDELKVEKKWDKDARSDTLKEVLSTKTRKGQKELLRKFHASKPPRGVKRRTALKFDKGAEI